jgi:hypothetical protein
MTRNQYISEVRARYPDAVGCPDLHDPEDHPDMTQIYDLDTHPVWRDRYCPLGAVTMYCDGASDPRFYGASERFPCDGDGCLKVMNQCLTDDKAAEFTRQIIKVADEGDIEAAWSLLEDAYNWTPSEA